MRSGRGFRLRKQACRYPVTLGEKRSDGVPVEAKSTDPHPVHQRAQATANTDDPRARPFSSRTPTREPISSIHPPETPLHHRYPPHPRRRGFVNQAIEVTTPMRPHANCPGPGGASPPRKLYKKGPARAPHPPPPP